jgi:hypothetical protein
VTANLTRNLPRATVTPSLAHVGIQTVRWKDDQGEHRSRGEEAAPFALRSSTEGPMQTFDLQEGEELVLGNVRVSLLEVEGDTVLLRIEEGGEGRLEHMKVAAEEE